MSPLTSRWEELCQAVGAEATHVGLPVWRATAVPFGLSIVISCWHERSGTVSLSLSFVYWDPSGFRLTIRPTTALRRLAQVLNPMSRAVLEVDQEVWSRFELQSSHADRIAEVWNERMSATILSAGSFEVRTNRRGGRAIPGALPGALTELELISVGPDNYFVEWVVPRFEFFRELALVLSDVTSTSDVLERNVQILEDAPRGRLADEWGTPFFDGPEFRRLAMRALVDMRDMRAIRALLNVVDADGGVESAADESIRRLAQELGPESAGGLVAQLGSYADPDRGLYRIIGGLLRVFEVAETVDDFEGALRGSAEHAQRIHESAYRDDLTTALTEVARRAVVADVVAYAAWALAELRATTALPVLRSRRASFTGREPAVQARFDEALRRLEEVLTLPRPSPATPSDLRLPRPAPEAALPRSVSAEDATANQLPTPPKADADE